MKKIISICAILLFIRCQFTHETAQTSFDNLTHSVDEQAAITLYKGHINSLAIAVYRNGQLYHNYYGTYDLNKANKPNDSTLYEVASISKVFAGSLAAKAVLEGKINLADDIRKYLDGDYPNLAFDGKPITIKDLLTHTLGFAKKTPPGLDAINQQVNQGFYANKIIPYAMPDFLEELHKVTLDKAPGTHYEYNSVGPELIAYILQKAYNAPYKDLLAAFFNDLDMKNTHLQDYNQYKNYLAPSYDENNNRAPIHQNPLLGGSYGILTTLPDLTKFLKFQLESKNLLIKESTRNLFKDDDENMGYFWDLGFQEKEGFYYLKTGTSGGVQSIILVCPDTHYGLILIMNNTSEEAQSDWLNLYNTIERDLIHFPKKNLEFLLEQEINTNATAAIKKYETRKKDTVQYYTAGVGYLNNLGYQLLAKKQIKTAIQVFELAVSQAPDNGNLYDSLGEAYFMDHNFSKALENYQQSLQLNPANTNAKTFILKINEASAKEVKIVK